jgi:hypothetical protein
MGFFLFPFYHEWAPSKLFFLDIPKLYGVCFEFEEIFSFSVNSPLSFIAESR